MRAQAEVNIAVASVETAGELARLARDRHELDVLALRCTVRIGDRSYLDV